MIIETMIISLIVGYIFGGRLKNIEEIEINYGKTFFFLIVIEMICILIISNFDNNISRVMVINFSVIHLLIYFGFLICIFLNRHLKGFGLIFLGSLFNFIPMIFNKGKMPVYYDALIKANILDQLELLMNNKILTHNISFTKSGVFFLGDIIGIGSPYILPKVISIGDIIFALGIFIFLQYSMGSFKFNENKR